MVVNIPTVQFVLALVPAVGGIFTISSSFSGAARVRNTPGTFKDSRPGWADSVRFLQKYKGGMLANFKNFRNQHTFLFHFRVCGFARLVQHLLNRSKNVENQNRLN